MDFDKNKELVEPGLSEENGAMLEKGFEFKKVAKKAREGKQPDIPIKFECPVCKGTGVTSYFSYNVHPRLVCMQYEFYGLGRVID